MDSQKTFSKLETLIIVGVASFAAYLAASALRAPEAPHYQITAAYGTLMRVNMQTGDIDICTPHQASNLEYMACQ
jgi:hypothetical protein